MVPQRTVLRLGSSVSCWMVADSVVLLLVEVLLLSLCLAAASSVSQLCDETKADDLQEHRHHYPQHLSNEI